MGMIRGLVQLAWAGLILAVITQMVLRGSASHPWPDSDDFSFTFNAILIEFAVNTLALTALLFYPNWYERIPRESAARLRHLLFAVILWFSVHVFTVFHVTGSLGGFGMALLPILLIASLAYFPGINGVYLAAYLFAGHLLVVSLEQYNVILSKGALSQHFMLFGEASPGGLLGSFMVCLLAAVLGIKLRHRIYPELDGLGPAHRIDPDSGLFRRRFLDHRIQAEIARMRRQGGSAALLLVAVEEKAKIAQLGAVLLKQIRIESDTPASFSEGVIAVLLPALDADLAESVAKRLVCGIRTRVADCGHLRAAIAVVASSTLMPQALPNLAEQALKDARPGEDPVVISAHHSVLLSSPT